MSNKKVSPAKAVVKWDDLIPVFNDVKKQITVFSEALYKTEATYKLILEKDEELTKEMNGAFGVADDLVKELVKILSLHSVKVENEIKPFIGVISSDDDKAAEIYTNTILAYDSFQNRLEVIMEQVTSHLVAKINAYIELNKK